MRTVISGGQSGAQLAAIHAAEAANLHVTGQRSTNKYNNLLTNLKMAQATVRIGGNKTDFENAPKFELCEGRPIYDVYILDPYSPHLLALWLAKYETVNFTGSSEEVQPGIYKLTKAFLLEAFGVKEVRKFIQRKRIKV